MLTPNDVRAESSARIVPCFTARSTTWRMLTIFWTRWRAPFVSWVLKHAKEERKNNGQAHPFYLG